jgi:long-chain fatty acid transport protein
MKKHLGILLIALAISLFYPAAYLLASSIAVPAIGGNFSGPVEDNVAAIFWNPAALGQLEGKNIFTTINTSFLNFTYKSEADPWTGEEKDYPEVKSSTFSTPPFLGFASDYGPEKLVWGVGFYAPFGGALDWPDEVTLSSGTTEPAPQRFQMIMTDIMCLTFGPAASYRILDNLMVGAGVSFNYGMLDSELVSKEEADMKGVEIEGGYIEARATEEGLSGIAFGWSLGILWKPLENLDIGASYISGLNFTLKGDIKIEVEPHDMLVYGVPSFIDLTLTGKGDITLKPFKLPQMINFGAEYRPTDKIELDLALRWEGWSVRNYSNAEIDVPIEGTLGSGPLEQPISDEISKTHRLDWGLKNVFGLRVWGMYRLLEKLKLGAGFGWEQGAGSPEYTSVENYSTDRIRLFGGGQYEADFWIFENLVLELSYLHAFYGDLTVKDESKKDPPVIGSFGGMLDFISFGAAYKF